MLDSLDSPVNGEVIALYSTDRAIKIRERRDMKKAAKPLKKGKKASAVKPLMRNLV